MRISSHVEIKVSEMLGIFLGVPANSWTSEATQPQSYLERNEVLSSMCFRMKEILIYITTK